MEVAKRKTQAENRCEASGYELCGASERCGAVERCGASGGKRCGASGWKWQKDNPKQKIIAQQQERVVTLIVDCDWQTGVLLL